MVKKYEKIVLKAVALCYKPFIKPEEALIYCNLGRTQLAKKCDEYGVYKNDAGYYKREELDRMMAGVPHPLLKMQIRSSCVFVNGDLKLT